MSLIKSPASLLLVFSLTTFSVMGCASLRSGPAQELGTAPVKSETAGRGWWYASFAINWPQGAEPAWYMDLLLAHRVISPVLAAYRSEIMLWRFHRRAARDKAGHQFSFIFYSSRQTARNVYDAIRRNRILMALEMDGSIIRESDDDTNVIKRPNIEDTSDRSWAPVIQKTWPYYIMGVSRMWLNLIADLADNTAGGKTADSPEELKVLYQKVNKSVTELWQREGGHAFLHHLNALFGYEPVIIREQRLMEF
jgi:hypothetical protein